MIVVTGAAGFIGSNIIKELNNQGHTNILAVDDLKKGEKFTNLVDLEISDYLDKNDFLSLIDGAANSLGIDVIFHQGACSATTEWDGKYLMKNNFEYSKELFRFCFLNIPLLYASSAATYGTREDNFIEKREFEKPINAYGFSKFLFDQYVREHTKDFTINQTNALFGNGAVCGFKYFNVYGYNEQHKGAMASVMYHFNNQIKNGETIKLFAGSENFKRDFIFVEDVAKINVLAWQNKISGIFNLGTGKARSFVDVAREVIKFHKKGEIEFIDFPEHLKNHYQKFTQADLTNLRTAGIDFEFTSFEEGIYKYLQWLNS